MINLRKIIYNQAMFFDKEYKKYLKHLFITALSSEDLDTEVRDLIEFSNKYYETEKFWVSPDILKQKYPKFEFIEESFESEVNAIHTIQEEVKIIRTDIVRDLSLKMNQDMPNKDKTVISKKIHQLQLELEPEDEVELEEINSFDIRSSYEERKNKHGGILTNIQLIDEKTGGITAGKVCVIMSPPANGKTTMLLNMSYMESMMDDSNALIMTLELSKAEFNFKGTIRHSWNYRDTINLSTLNILKGKLTPEQEPVFYSMFDDWMKKKKSQFYVCDVNDDLFDFSSINGFKTKLEVLIKRYNIKSIYVDYLQLFSAYQTSEYKNEMDFLNAIVGMFRVLGVKYNVRFILLAQLTDESIKKAERNNGEFSITSVNLVKALNRDAYYMIALFMNDELKVNGQFKYQLLKHRDGETIQKPVCSQIRHNYFYMGTISNVGSSMINNTQDNSGSDLCDMFGIE